MDDSNQAKMEDLLEQVLEIVTASPGLTDREITDGLLGRKARVQRVNYAAHLLVQKGKIERRLRPDGRMGSYAAGTTGSHSVEGRRKASLPDSVSSVVNMSEEDVKRNVKKWLEAAGWDVGVDWEHGRGIDIEAKRGKERWVIEAKGSGSRNPIKHIYFLTVLGETLQRMDDPDTHYGIALPDTNKFRKLWTRLPDLAKSRMRIKALFVGSGGKIDLVD